MNKNYWDEKYWEKHLREDDLENVEELWVRKYEHLIDVNEHRNVLDLGCGIGQYTRYFLNRGHHVTSSDISKKALEYLKNNIPTVRIVQQDMSEPLKFEDNEFDIVFANLSIHFFSKEETDNLIKEIRRILKPGGFFIGSVNSTSAYEHIKDHVVELEENFYDSNGRSIRLWDEKQFEYFFKDLDKIVLNEVIEKRWDKQKNMWEFIYKNK